MNNMEEHKKVIRENFVNSIKDVIKPLHDMLLAWEKLDHSDNDSTASHNPFKASFDEWFAEYVEWASEIEKIFNSKKVEFEPTVTVGELKEILEKYEDDRHVVIATDGWYTNIGSIEFPDDYQTYTITLHPGSIFDPWQIGK